MEKIVVIDWMVFVHKAIFSWRNNKQLPMTYTLLNMIIGCLRKIGIEPTDTIYITTDYLKSWRKQYAEEYKANRKKRRDSYPDIDWKQMFNSADELLCNLKEGTDWIVLKGENLEADDFASYIVRNNSNKEIVLITIDSDWEQMWHFGDNIKIFSPLKKPKRYKIKPDKFNVYELIASKVVKEKSDNLISEIVTEEDYDTRMMLINLIELPDFIDKQIENVFNNLIAKKDIDLNKVPYNNLRERIENLYNDKDAIVTYKWSRKYEERKKKRLAKKAKKRKEKK